MNRETIFFSMNLLGKQITMIKKLSRTSFQSVFYNHFKFKTIYFNPVYQFLKSKSTQERMKAKLSEKENIPHQQII